MTMNRGQAARRRVGKLPPRRSKGRNSSSSVADQGANAAASSSSSKKESDSKMTDTGTIPAQKGWQQDNEDLPHDVRDFEAILSGSALKKVANALEAAAKTEVDGPCTVQFNISDAEQQSEGKDVEHCDSEEGVGGEAEAEAEHVTERKDQEESGSVSEDEHDNEAGGEEEENDASTSDCGSSSSGSDATSSSRGGDVSSSSSSSERTSLRDLKGCRAELKRIEASEALGLNLDDYEDRCLLENANLTREEIADVKDRVHRFNVKFIEATRADDGEGWLEGTILRMHGVVRHFERRAEGEGRRMTHAERHIVKMARMAMVDCQHVLAKERRMEERGRGGG